MGYNTRFIGEIKIEPPLKWAEMKDSPYIDPKQYADFAIEVRKYREDTADGVMIFKEGYAIVPFSEEPYKGYEALSTLQEIVSAFPGHTFHGGITGYGEESGDIRKYVVVDGEAEEWIAELVWPDGTKEPTR